MSKVRDRLKALSFVLSNLKGKVEELEKKNEDEEFQDFLKFCFINLYDMMKEYEEKNTITYKLVSLIFGLVVLVSGGIVSHLIPEGWNYLAGFIVAFAYFNITSCLR